MKIRRAILSDADIGAALIFNSGPNSLSAMFDISQQFNALDFLRFAFSQPYGQFGFTSHLSVETSGKPIAIGSCWTHQPSQSFRSATLQSLVGFYGLELTQEVISRSQCLADIIPSPNHNELGVGHIATVENARRQGAASLLLNHFVELGNKLDKDHLVLDVEETNQQAIDLYTHFGFQKSRLSRPDDVGKELGLTTHWHMRLSL